MRFVVGIFLILHGIVYLLYFGHSMRLFELRPGLLWPEAAWRYFLYNRGSWLPFRRYWNFCCTVMVASAYHMYSRIFIRHLHADVEQRDAELR